MKRRDLLITICALFLLGGKGKEGEKPEFYPCIRYEYNVIEPASELGLQFFFNRLDQFLEQRKGKVNIVHIGDSHIQADYLSHSARKKFQQTFGNGGRGFIFPHRMARTNNAYSVGIQYSGNWTSLKSVNNNDQGTFGMAGITLKTADSSATFMFNPNKLRDMNHEFNRMRLFYAGSEYNFGIQFMEAIPGDLDYDEIPVAPNESILFFERPVDSLWMYLEKDAPFQTNFELYGMSLENNYPGLIYHGIGLNGAYAKSYLRNQLLTEHLPSLHPDLVIVSLGTNDGFVSGKKFCINCFKESYRTLLQQISKSAPNASLLLTTPGDNFIRGRQYNPNVSAITDAIYELAAEFNAALWDFNKVMGGPYSMRSWHSYGLAQKDLVHFTEIGYNVIGTLLYDAIMQSYECRFDR